jgi:hypothetical protein
MKMVKAQRAGIHCFAHFIGSLPQQTGCSACPTVSPEGTGRRIKGDDVACSFHH